MTEKIKVIDSFYEQMKNNLNLDTKDSAFGKEYTVKNSDSSATVLKRFFFDNKYEVCFLNCNGKTTYEYQKPEGKESREDIIEIVYYYSGKTKMISQPGNKTYNLKKGDIGIYSYKNNNILYCFEHDNASAISINLYVERIKEDFNLKTVNDLISKWNSEISDIFKVDECIIEKADAEIETLAFQVCNIPLTEINDYFQFKTKIIQLFYLILKKFLKSPSSTDVEKYSNSITSEKIKSLINTYPLSEIPTIKELCKIMKVSNYYFQSAFKNSEGISVKQYILNLKMNHAKFLLETTNYSIFDVSIEVGYENPSKFAKTFKSYFGIFPSKYRKNFHQ